MAATTILLIVDGLFKVLDRLTDFLEESEEARNLTPQELDGVKQRRDAANARFEAAVSRIKASRASSGPVAEGRDSTE